MNGGGRDIGEAPPPQGVRKDQVKYPRKFLVVMDDAGGFIVNETRDDIEFACSQDGSQVAQRQQLVQRIAPTRVDVKSFFDEWCNLFSELLHN